MVFHIQVCFFNATVVSGRLFSRLEPNHINGRVPSRKTKRGRTEQQREREGGGVY